MIHQIMKEWYSVIIYNLFDFFIKFDRFVLFEYFAKNNKFEAIVKVYYILNDIIVNINNNSENILIRELKSSLFTNQVQTAEVGLIKRNAQATYGLRFRCSK